MTHTSTENERSVAEVVEALIGVEDESSEGSDLEVQTARAATEVDARTAESYCRVLIGHLTDDSESVPELEALLILGLAHPSVFAANHISLGQEGRRLAQLIERAGNPVRAQALLELIAARAPEDRQVDHELASMMRRTGNADRLIERYMRRAEECVSSNRTKEAISWLQEILLVDRSRRDVARMIRDLRWGDQEKRTRLRGRVRGFAILLVVVTLVTMAVQRERAVDSSYAAVPLAVSGDLGSLRQRLQQLDRLQEEHPFSLRLWDASRERARLKVEIAQIEAQSAQLQIARHGEREAQLAIAESARKQGRIYTQQNRFAEALEQFDRALAEGPGDWDQRKQIQIDVAAIQEWTAQHGSQAPGSVK